MTTHFTWDEMTKTDAPGLQEENRAAAEQFRPALETLASLLEVLREAIGGPLVIRAFRCAKVNANVSGSSSMSQHLKGEAADLRLPGQHGQAQVRNLFDVCREHLAQRRTPFGQLIFEQKEREDGSWSYWVHVSLGEPWREKDKCGQVLEMEWPWNEANPKYSRIKEEP